MTEAPRSRYSMKKLARTAGSFGVRLLPIVAFVALWEGVSRLELVNPLLFPPPSKVWYALREWAGSGELVADIKASYIRMLAGFAVGGAVGVVVGLGTGRSRSIRAVLSPIVQLLRPLPPVAIIPLVIVWLGIGDTAKVFSTAFAVFFPVWINTHLGASAVPLPYLWSARLLCRSRLRIAMSVILPAALPAVVAGLRTSIPIAFIMVYVGEIAGASSGIGYRISVCHLAYRIDKMVAALAVLAAAGALADYVFAVAVHVAFPWMNRGASS